MKKLMLIPLLTILSGCATYYYPAVESSDGAYYAEQDQNYTDYSGSYANARYYPWWSVDYFYLGSGRGHSNFSIGFDYGYGYNSPWYDPFYSGFYPYSFSYFPYYYPSRYSFWYTPFYDHHYGHHYNHYAGFDHYWRHRYNRHHRYAHRDHDRWSRHNRDRYAHDDHGGDGYDHAGYREQDRNSGNNRNRENLRPRGEDRAEYSPVTRHVSVAPGRGSVNRGMEVRRREERKQARTRLEPSGPVTQISPATRIVTSRPQPRSQAFVSSRTPTGEVRSRAGNKQGRTRIAPVAPAPDTPVISRGSANSGRVVISRRGSATVRSPRQGKSRPVRTQPVQPQPLKSFSREIVSPSIRIAPARQQRPAATRQQRPAAPRQQRPAPPRQQISAPRRQHQAAVPRAPQRSSPPPRQHTAKSTGSKSRSASARPSSGRNNSAHSSSRPEKRNRR